MSLELTSQTQTDGRFSHAISDQDKLYTGVSRDTGATQTDKWPLERLPHANGVKDSPRLAQKPPVREEFLCHFHGYGVLKPI